MAKKNKKFVSVVVIIVILIAAISLFFPKKSIAPNGRAKTSGTATATANLSNNLSNLNWPKGQTVNAAVLMYHHVGPVPAGADDIRRGLTVSATNFTKQLQYLKDNNFNVLTLAELYQAVANGKVPEKTVVLTFDDGYEDNFTVAYPKLQEFGYKATFFIITSKVGMADYMNEDQLKQLSKSGNEIASHTVHHLSLDTVSGITLEREITESKTYLEKLTGVSVIDFCYPSGKFSDEAKKDLKEAGYKMAVTTEPSKGSFSSDKPYEVPRFRISPTTNLESLLK
jgi:peptidoglycan/xylan/chitin deacetylase (PgdA/CDA1 family)